MPSATQTEAVDTAQPLTAESLAKMTFEDLVGVAQEYHVDDEYISGLNQKGLHDYLLLYFCFDRSPSPANSALGDTRSGEAPPVGVLLDQRRRALPRSRSPSPRSPEIFNIPKDERAHPPRDTNRPTIDTRVYKPSGTPRPHDRNALNRPSPEETPEPDSDDGALASTEAVKHAIQLLREYRKGNIDLKAEADDAIAEVEKLHRDICDIKQAVMMRRTLRRRLEAYIPYQRIRPDTWELEQVFPDIPRFTQTLHGEEYEVDAVDADNDPHLKKLMDRNYSRNAEKLDKPTSNGIEDSIGHDGSDDENADEENQVNRGLSSIDPEEDTGADSATVPFNDDDANAQFSPVVTTTAKSQLLKILVASMSRDAALAARRIGHVEPSMDLEAFSARLQADSEKGNLCRIDDVRAWVNARRQAPGYFTNGEDKEWDVYMWLFDVVEAFFEIYCANRACGLQEERLNDEGEPLGPYELYWHDNSHFPLFPSQWAEAMKGYERYCEFSRIMKLERAHSSSADVPAAASRPTAGPSRETSVFIAPRDSRSLKRTASQASLGHAAPDGSSKLPSQLPGSQRASKQRKTGLSADEVVRIRQQSQDAEEHEHASEEEVASPPARVWKGKGRMIYTPPRPTGSPNGVVNVSSGSNSGDSPGKFPASWMKPKPVDGPVRASLERRAASIESSRRSQSGSPGGSDAGGLSLPTQRKAPPGRTPTRSPSPVPEKDARYRKLLHTPVGGEGEMRYKRPPLSFGGYDPEAEPVSPSPAGPAPATIRRRFAKEANMQALAGVAIGSAISKAKASVSGLVRRMSGEFSSLAGEGKSGDGDEVSSPTPVAGPSRISEPSISAAGPSRHTNSSRRGGPYRTTRSHVVATYTSTAPAVAAIAPPPAGPVAPYPPAPAAAPAPAVPAPMAPLAAAATLATPPGSPVERRLRSRVVRKNKN